jgi:hypothetical protein
LGLVMRSYESFWIFLKMGLRGGTTGGEERHVDAVLLSSSTVSEDFDRAQYDVGRPWHYPSLVKNRG